MNDKINWFDHIKQLSLKISKHTGIIDRLRNFVAKYVILNMLYYSVIYSRMQFDIVICDTCANNKLHEIKSEEIMLFD